MKSRKVIVPLLLLFYLVMVIVFSLFSFFKERKKLYKNLDSTLYAAAYSLDIILGKDFHDKYNPENPISAEKYRELKEGLNSFSLSLGLEYVYSMVRKNDTVYFVVSNETEEDIIRDTPSLFYNPYPNPPMDLTNAFESGLATFHYYSSYTNIWDSYYSIFIPRDTAKGLRYILAADIKLKDQKTLLKECVFETVIFVFILLIPLIPVYIMLRSVAMEKEKGFIIQLYTDALTGLPNRQKFFEDCKVNQEGDRSIIMLDIDSFRDINNLFGSNIGDKVLFRISEIIREICGSESNLYKFPVDEFVILTQEPSLDKIVSMVRSILSGIASENFLSTGQPLDLTVRAGIAFRPENQNKLLSSVNIAKNYAKIDRKGYAIYNESLNLEKKYSMNFFWLSKLKEALRDNRIVPFYQPIQNNNTGNIEKYEALVRLIDTDGSVITPDHFLDVAKRSKLYRRITHAMILQSFTDFAGTDYSVSLNLSTRDVIDEDTVNFIIENVKKFSMQGRVIIELVESESITEYETVISLTHQFSNLGIKIAIDDFGSGYSNFEYIAQFNTDFIKIDGSIVRNILEDKTSDALVAAIASFAKELNIAVIAEYVNKEEIMVRLKELNIQYSQGYYIGKPVPYSELKLEAAGRI